MQRVPARIGDQLAAVETPGLVIDLDAFELAPFRVSTAASGRECERLQAFQGLDLGL